MSIRITTNCSTHLRYSIDSRQKLDRTKTKSVPRSNDRHLDKKLKRRLKVQIGVSQLSQLKGSLPHNTQFGRSVDRSYKKSTNKLSHLINPLKKESTHPNYILPCLSMERRTRSRAKLTKIKKNFTQIFETKQMLSMPLPYDPKPKSQINTSDISTMVPSNNSSKLMTPIILKRRLNSNIVINKQRRVGGQIQYLKKGLKKEICIPRNGDEEGLKEEFILDKKRQQTGQFEKCLSSIYYFLNSEPIRPKKELVEKKKCPQFSDDYDPRKPLLVLDMDETLLHTEFTKKRLGYHAKIEDNEGYKYYVSYNFYLIQFISCLPLLVEY